MMALRSLVALTVFLTHGAYGQAVAPRPAFTVILLLVRSVDEVQQWLTALPQARARSRVQNVDPGDTLYMIAVVTGSGLASRAASFVASCDVIGPQGTIVIQQPQCVARTESDPRLPNMVFLSLALSATNDATDLPGIYTARVRVTDQAKGTSGIAAAQFNFLTSSGVSQAAPAARDPSADSSRDRAPRDGSLAGLYVGGDYLSRARWYWFKPSGAVAVDFVDAMIDPDDALTWPTYKVYVATEAERQGFHVVPCTLGSYQLVGSTIRWTTRDFQVDPARKVKFVETVYGETFDQNKKNEDVRRRQGLDVVQVGPLVLVRQQEQAGRTLEGEYAIEAVGVERVSGRARFTSTGEFAMNVGSLYTGPGAGGSLTGTAIPPGGSTGTGRYEVRRHEIVFYNSDGTISKQLFGYLGADGEGGETITVGGLVWTKGLFAKE